MDRDLQQRVNEEDEGLDAAARPSSSLRSLGEQPSRSMVSDDDNETNETPAGHYSPTAGGSSSGWSSKKKGKESLLRAKDPGAVRCGRTSTRLVLGDKLSIDHPLSFLTTTANQQQQAEPANSSGTSLILEEKVSSCCAHPTNEQAKTPVPSCDDGKLPLHHHQTDTRLRDDDDSTRLVLREKMAIRHPVESSSDEAAVIAPASAAAPSTDTDAEATDSPTAKDPEADERHSDDEDIWEEEDDDDIIPIFVESSAAAQVASAPPVVWDEGSDTYEDLTETGEHEDDDDVLQDRFGWSPPVAVEIKDVVSGCAVEYFETNQEKNRRIVRRRIQICVAILLLIVVVIVVLTLVYTVMKPQKPSLPSSLPPLPTPAPTTLRQTLGIDRAIVAQAMADTDDHNHDPDLFFQDASYRRALDWIVREDPMQLLPDASNLLQRFVLAVVYFKYGPWLTGCNPLADDYDGAECVWQRLNNISPLKYFSLTRMRWLSGVHECLWAGLTCYDTNVVEHVDIRGNELTGPLPIDFRYLRNLTRINLVFNHFRGTIPVEWYTDLKQLEVLSLHHNDLTGPLPADITALTLLKELGLSGNDFTGTLHTEYATLTNLTLLEVRDNQLSGMLPTEYRALTHMTSLSLGQNAFAGTIPSEWFDSMTQLRTFQAHFTKMTGTIPENIYNVRTLEILYLDHDKRYDGQFFGTLSTKVGQLSNLALLRLRGNHFYGTIPTELGNLAGLIELWLNYNDFTGTMPEQVCVNRQLFLDILLADCLPSDEPPLVECDLGCCTLCCDPLVRQTCDRTED